MTQFHHYCEMNQKLGVIVPNQALRCLKLLSILIFCFQNPCLLRSSAIFLKNLKLFFLFWCSNSLFTPFCPGLCNNQHFLNLNSNVEDMVKPHSFADKSSLPVPRAAQDQYQVHSGMGKGGQRLPPKCDGLQKSTID